VTWVKHAVDNWLNGNVADAAFSFVRLSELSQHDFIASALGMHGRDVEAVGRFVRAAMRQSRKEGIAEGRQVELAVVLADGQCCECGDNLAMATLAENLSASPSNGHWHLDDGDVGTCVACDTPHYFSADEDGWDFHAKED
jgi:hypothetical protein